MTNTASRIGKSYAAPVVSIDNNDGEKRRYEGAADGRRASSWFASGNKSVNLVIAKDLAALVMRSRELAINNSYARKAPWVLANNIVGTGILLNPSISDKIEKGIVKKQQNKTKLQKTISLAWKEWADSITADYNGDSNFYGLQHLAIRTKVISGEILAVRRWVPQTENKYGFQVLLLEGDFIDKTKDNPKEKGGGYTFKGIKYSKDGKRLGYWLYDRHVSEGNAKSSFYELKDVIHFYEVERPGQNRGVPDSSSTITTQKDFGDYMDAELMKQKAAACFGAIVQKDSDVEGNNQDDDELEELQPGAFHYLNPGETIHFPTLPQNPGLTDFVKVQLRSIAAGYLMPYENLTGDLSNVTFISGRLGQLDFKKQVEYWQHSSFIPKFCERVFQWFVEGAKIALDMPADLQITGSWTAPRWQMMDPLKEISAMLLEVQAGFATWSEKVRENGYDPAEVLEEMTKDQKDFVTAGLTPKWSQYFELMEKVKMNQGKEEDPKEDPKE